MLDGKQQDARDFLAELNEAYSFFQNLKTTKELIIKDPDGNYQSKKNQETPTSMLLLHLSEQDIELDQLIKQHQEPNLCPQLNADLSQYSSYNTNLKDLSQLRQATKINGTQEVKEVKVENHLQVTHLNDPLPHPLCVWLLRFTDRFTKNPQKVLKVNAITLNTTNLCLHGAIIHHGNSLHGGHYTAYVKKSGQWYHANDQTTTAVTEQEAFNASEDAYLLFYK